MKPAIDTMDRRVDLPGSLMSYLASVSMQTEAIISISTHANELPGRLAAIIFDMDDTLLVEEDSACAAFMATCEYAAGRCGVDAQQLYVAVRSSCRALWHEAPGRAYCLRVGISSWEGLWAEFRGEDENLRLLRRWSKTYRDTSWHNALLECGVGDVDLASELGSMYITERRARHVVYDDVVPALGRLSEAHRLGLLTNGCPDLQRRKLDASGLSRFFDEVVIAGEVGIGKPDVRVFELLLSRMGTNPCDAAMVGNSLRSDIQPANALGMTSIWVNRAGKPNDGAVRPSFEVASLAGILGAESPVVPDTWRSASIHALTHERIDRQTSCAPR